jgi:hypothetical protein
MLHGRKNLDLALITQLLCRIINVAVDLFHHIGLASRLKSGRVNGSKCTSVKFFDRFVVREINII